MSVQLQIELEPAPENPNAWMFHPDGTTKMLMWPGDDVRIMHERGQRRTFAQQLEPLHGCCSARCPKCNPDPFRCQFGCCP